ncbi:nitrilase-related carbon-nitrogen hydrolase [Sphingobacterium sp. MYb382]|uniref:nitrilase-related carbon-nitrogen hydrolase n=1 Tax=Sphingobacterium sp. MYb382 TaxID=2745278 RepID=UPI0030A3ADFB
MKVALVSFNSVWESKDASLEDFKVYVQKAALNGANCIIFPEMTLTGFSMNSEKLAEPFNDSVTIKEYQKLAVKYKIKLIAGVILREGGNIYNCCVVVSEYGDILEIYKKIHPFSYSGEEKFYAAGSDLKQVNFVGGWGITICYDLRFPELYQALAVDNNVIVNIASWPERRDDHWQSLLKARAIENQVYMIGVNRSGIDGNDLHYAGNSIIYSATGSLLEAVIKEDDMKIFDLDVDAVEVYRKSFPVKSDRRIDLYSTWLNKSGNVKK